MPLSVRGCSRILRFGSERLSEAIAKTAKLAGSLYSLRHERYKTCFSTLLTPSTTICFLFLCNGPCFEERDVARAREEELFELLNEKAMGQCSHQHSRNTI